MVHPIAVVHLAGEVVGGAAMGKVLRPVPSVEDSLLVEGQVDILEEEVDIPA